MISVVCSTRSIDENFEKMVRKNSGIKNEDLEMLLYENNGEMSLTQAYNKGLSESKNDIVVFMHDDIYILSKDWARKLIKHYNETDYAILGVAGTKKLDETGVWWNERQSMYGCVSHTDGFKSWTSEYSYNFGNRIKDAVVVDGVFFSCNKKRIKKTFDESYKGFHFYDISFCFDNFKEDVKIGIHFDISIKHKSVGDVNDAWEENRKLFVSKESENLPQFSYIEVPFVDTKTIIENDEKLAIIIPTKNNVDELLIPCINSIIENTRYKNYKIYVADTGSNETELIKVKNFISCNDNIVLVEYDYYNFAKINNDMVDNHIDNDTDLLLFCNNDVEMLNDAISIMVKTHKTQNKVGTVGCRLHYENGSIQHMGISLEVNAKNELKITHKYVNWDYENVRESKVESFTHGNSASFMLVSKKLFVDVGGFNEIYNECFEDVEFNLRCILKNKINVTTSRGVCYHYESKTRTLASDQSDINRLLAFVNENPILSKTFNKIN